ncbi:MAG: hypothetical protein ACK4GN_10015 [Runella sp.]
MTSLFFWKNWPLPQRFLLLINLRLLIFGLVAMLYFEWQGIENLVEWQVLSQLGDVPTRLDSLQTATQKVVLMGKSYLLKEQFVPIQNLPPDWFVAGYLGFILIGFVLLLAGITALPRRAYLVSMMVFIGLLAWCHLEMLQLGGSDKPLGFALIVSALGGLSYYLHVFRPDIGTERRIFLFAGLVAMLVLAVSFFAKSPLPALTFASYSLLPMLFVSVVFIGWVAIEVIASFVYLTTHPRLGFGKNSLLNFLFLSGLYLLSLFLIYQKITRRTEADFWYISPFVLLAASTILGIWGLVRRIDELLSFRYVAIWLYLGMALVATAVLSWAWFTYNNSLIEVLEDAIVYSQLAIGLIFTVYVGLNFWPIFRQGKAVYKIIYKPLHISQVQMWLIGLTGVVLLLAFHRFYSIDQAQAAYKNTLGDLHTATGEYAVAEQYYQQALDHDYRNHKSGFSLANLALRQGDRISAGAFYQQALHKDPTPQAFAGLSQALLNENLFFDAVFTLRKGLKVFPDNAYLQNNLGYLYTRTSLADSAFYYYRTAYQNAKNNDVAATNLLALALENDLTLEDLGIANLLDPRPSLSHEANRLAFGQYNKTKVSAQKRSLSFPSDSALSVNNFAYLYNYAQTAKDTQQADLLRKLIANGNNGNFYHELHLAQAYSEYPRNKLAALDLLASQTVADTSQKVALARQTLQFWLLQESVQSVSPQKLASLKTPNDYLSALRQYPFDEHLLQKSVQFFNQQKKPEIGYQALLDALRFRRDSAPIQKMYILQCLSMSLTDFAEEGLRNLYAITTPADYQAFWQTYQAQRTLIEKQRQTF